MKTIENILTPEEIVRYQEGWRNFRDKYKLNSNRHTHSGKPVISRTYRFEDKHIFRAHVFGKRLKKFDPYFVASEHPSPFWHAQHYFMVEEQMYSAVLHLSIGDEYNKRIAKDVPLEFNWRKPVFFDDNISVELIRIEEGKLRSYDKETGYFTFYSDKTGRVLSRMSASSYWQDRTYVQLLRRLKQEELSVLDKLIRVIEMQDINQKKRTPPRKKLQVTKEGLIALLKSGKIPEQEMDDFFSYWDPD